MSNQRESATDGESDAGPPIELITASVSELAYGLESGHVMRVATFDDVIPVPGTVPAVDGVADIDGEVTVIVDATLLLGGERRAPVETDELIILGREDKRPIGLRTPRGVGVEIVPSARFVRPTAPDAAVASDPQAPRVSPDESLLRAVVKGDDPTKPPRYVLDVPGIAAAVET